MLKVSKVLILCLLILTAQFSVASLPTSLRFEKVLTKTKPALTQALEKKGLAYGSPIFIRVFKKSAKLELWMQTKSGNFTLFKTYNICYFSGNLGPKTQEGDRQSPEGFYFVNGSRLNPWSRFHLSFNIGYPNSYDRAKGYTGSALMVHGSCVSIGCYAMTNAHIDEIYTLAFAALESGQPFFRVHIFPFKLEDETLNKYKKHLWYEFWENLQEGYQYFEANKKPPNVTVENGRYVFE